LVTAEGEIKLLDFGIAKLTTEGSTHETELTEIGGRALTLKVRVARADSREADGRRRPIVLSRLGSGFVRKLLTGGARHRARETRGALEEAHAQRRAAASDQGHTQAQVSLRRGSVTRLC